jgi:kynurenine formamidase
MAVTGQVDHCDELMSGRAAAFGALPCQVRTIDGITSRYVDLSHPLEHEMTTYPGLPGPAITTYISREKSAQRLGTGVSFHIGRIEMVANTGTYVDAPYHFHAKGADVAAPLLERLVDVPIVVIRASGRAAISPEVLDDPGVLWAAPEASKWLLRAVRPARLVISRQG